MIDASWSDARGPQRIQHRVFIGKLAVIAFVYGERHVQDGAGDKHNDSRKQNRKPYGGDGNHRFLLVNRVGSLDCSRQFSLRTLLVNNLHGSVAPKTLAPFAAVSARSAGRPRPAKLYALSGCSRRRLSFAG